MNPVYLCLLIPIGIVVYLIACLGPYVAAYKEGKTAMEEEIFLLMQNEPQKFKEWMAKTQLRVLKKEEGRIQAEIDNNRIHKTLSKFKTLVLEN
jgi:hypothetical protein